MNVFPPILPTSDHAVRHHAALDPTDYVSIEATDYGTGLLRRWINSHCDPSRMTGQEIAFSCLEGLLQFQMMRSPLDRRTVLNFTKPQSVWRSLRAEIDRRRLTHVNLPSFIRRHFDTQNPSITQACSNINDSHLRTIKELEIMEAQILSQMEVHSTEKSREMAILSIRESKRVMLLTMLAFIFIPVSLAASIYGMNVQQINGTGHSIVAFVITAILLVVVAFGLWGCTTMFVAFKNRRDRRFGKNKKN
jgi:hypothetical protein